MPEMVDSFGRVVRDLRVSVTDKCNFRCLYCMPEDGLPWLAKDDVLGRDELIRALRVAIDLGVRTVRITGGEPTLRRDLVDVVAALDGLGVELSITTNGFLMDRLAEPLRQAGLKRANISLDSLRRDRFKQITRRDALDRVLARLDAAFGLEAPDPRGSAPAERYRYRDGRGAVGVIASVTRAFCAQCDRIRLTADGQVRTCLFATTEYDLRSVLRSGAGDDAVAQVYLDAVARKQWGHRINEADFVQPARGMSQIGG